VASEFFLGRTGSVCGGCAAWLPCTDEQLLIYRAVAKRKAENNRYCLITLLNCLMMLNQSANLSSDQVLLHKKSFFSDE
jgi:hypothetical protein